MKDLRDFLKENGGAVEIGGLKMSIEGGNYGGGDVNFHVRGKLLGWIHRDVDDAKELDSTTSVKILDSFSLIEDAKEGEPAGTVVKEADSEKFVAIGKVEAYEKILLGRDVTVSR